MQMLNKLTVGKAADEFEISPAFIRKAIEEGHVEASRKSDAPKSPYLINRRSLMEFLHEKNKLNPLKYCILDVHGEEPGSNVMEPVDNSSTDFAHQKSVEGAKPFKLKQYRGASSKPRTFRCKLSMQQVKDAIRSMRLDESVALRDWLNQRINQKVNGGVA